MAKNSEDRKSKKKNGSKAKKELVAENRRLLALKREMNNEQRDLRRVVRELSKRIQEKTQFRDHLLQLRAQRNEAMASTRANPA